MAKINNQAIMQKLIDELELYPAKDTIPTELAEKLLPVYQVNTEDVNINLKENMKLYRDATLNANDRTIIVPDGKTWKIKMFDVYYIATATANPRYMQLEILDSSSNIIFKVENIASIGASNLGAHIMYYENAGNNETHVSDADKQFMHIRIPPLTLLEGYGIRIFDASNRDVNDDMVTALLVDEQDE